MALTYGFYNSVEGDRTYDAIQFGRIFDGLITDGIYANYEQGMAVMASENAGEVIIQPGRAWFNHTWSYNDSNYVMTAPAPEVLLDRIDALVLDIDTSLAARENKFMWVTGEPSSKPVKPTLIHTVTHNQYALCYVHRYPETTTIKAADITNVIGRETPFVAGVLNPIDVSTYIDQWDNEFHTWEDSTRSSFESWMITQQEIYTNWYDAIKNQMEGDLNDFETWFETIQGIIDEEAATHLQSEIDALAAMLPAGSHITVTTNEQSLYLRNVTVSDVAGHSATAKFDNTGVAVIESFPYIGNLTVTATDGTPAGTATEILPAPYFGRYNVNLAFWSATINLDGDSSVGGVVVKVKDHTGTQLSTVTLNASGKGVYSAAFPDTYTFEYTIGGDTMEVSLNVTEETTYSVEIYAGFNWRTWCTLGGVSTYGKTSLSDVFDDEEATRRLMTVHASADYLIDRVSHNVDDIDEFTVNDTAMKWIGLRDYVCDGLTAIDGVWTKFMASDYWERILKDHVPVMASNAAPYGEIATTATISTTTGKKLWNSFDRVLTTGAEKSSSTATADRIWYRFNNPINVRKLFWAIDNDTSSGKAMTIVVQYSDDGTNFTDACSYEIAIPIDAPFEATIDIPDCGYHTRWGFTRRINDGTKWAKFGTRIQFYGRSLNVSVPVMTSDTAPFGEVIYDTSNAATNSSYLAWKAFDGNDSTIARVITAALTAYVGYKFTQKTSVKKVYWYNDATNAGYTVRISYSDDGTNWTNTAQQYTINGTEKCYLDIEDCGAHLYWRATRTLSTAGLGICNTLQFYGVDYTEREFAEGSTMKYLYDHGLELETLITNTQGSGVVTKKENQVYMHVPASKSQCAYSAFLVDVSNYNLARAHLGDDFWAPSGGDCLGIGIYDTLPVYSLDSVIYVSFPNGAPNMAYNQGLDISSISGIKYVASRVANNSTTVVRTTSFSELWLE